MPLLLASLSDFAAEVFSKSQLTKTGQAEDQLRAPLETCIQSMGTALGVSAVCTGEFRVADIGRPDYAVYCIGDLCGYVEIKQPGKGADTAFFTGHDQKQWESFKALPNILYTDGNEWALYQNGERRGNLVHLAGNIVAEGKNAVTPDDAVALEPLIREFLTWNPIVPKDAKGLAKLLAPLCRLLRDEVDASFNSTDSPFQLLYKEWQTTLFPGQSPERFADAYAQTVTFCLLLANADGGDVLDLRKAEAALSAGHLLLAKTLKIFTDNLTPQEVPLSLAVLQRIVAAIPPAGFKAGTRDPWLYFYEDFLAEYDPQLRKDSGSYYTPVEAVQAMTRLTEEILVSRMGKVHGFAAPDVMTLDPAAGTGTFLISIIAETLAPIAEAMGAGAVAGYADTLARQLHGFELQVGPYAVAQLRLSRALTEHGAHLPADGPHIYLTDTLESPEIKPQFPSLLSRELSRQHKKALAIKKSMPILVCIGNPPYDRHKAAAGANRKETGGWVRWGDEDVNGEYQPRLALLDSFSAPVREAKQGRQLKNLYNLYVYFWRWALWKVFEQEEESPGIVAFITASSFLAGPAFAGMRALMRRLCHAVWVIDLGGEGRGSRKEENIFNIQTPVCIAIAVRYGPKEQTQGADVRYARIGGSREEKLSALQHITGFDSLGWQKCSGAWQDAFVPHEKSDFFSFPLLSDIFPWQHSGVQYKRTWPIAPDKSTLHERWCALLSAPDRASSFKETPDRKITEGYKKFFKDEETPLALLPPDADAPTIEAFGYRSFDMQYCFFDNRLCSRLRDALWTTKSDQQIYFATTQCQPIGSGPALTLSVSVPDLNFFCKRGAKDIHPLYRDAAAREPNILPGLLELLGKAYSAPVSPADLAAYVYAVLAHDAFSEKFRDELGSCEIRVPLTKDGELFRRAVTVGRRLILLHSHGQRLAPENAGNGAFTHGTARCVKAVPGDPDGYPAAFFYNESTKTLSVGEGEFAPVSPAVYSFEVSGLKVVQSWLKYRMKAGAGRKSSPLNDIRPKRWTSEFTEGLLRLLWLLEATLAEYPGQGALLEEILGGELFKAGELPPVPPKARKAPLAPKKVHKRQGSLLE